AISTAYTIAKFGSDDSTVAVASASTDTLIGVIQHTTSAAGEAVRVMLSGITRLKLGGTVARGAFVTSDSNGMGVTASPGSGVNATVIGIALASGVSGDIIPLLLAPGRIQG
ncbi:MAG: DUF2190 family protein, partial [Candidatus Caldarchaeum sp.]